MLIQLLYIAVWLSVCWFVWLRKSTKSTVQEASGKLPIIGHIHNFVGNNKHVWEVVKKYSRESLKHGGVVSFSLGSVRTFYVITDPDDCLTISNKRLEKDYVYNFAKPWLGNSLPVAEVPIWKKNRKLLNPLFRQQALYGFIVVFNSMSRKLANRLAVEVGKRTFDISPYLTINNLETICKTSLGIEISEDNNLNAEYIRSIDFVLSLFIERFRKVWIHIDFIFNMTNLKKKQDKAIDVLHKMTSTVLKKRKLEIMNRDKTKEEGKEESAKFKPFMDLFLDLEAEGGRVLSDKEIQNELDTLIFAGYDTSATTLLYTFILLGSYPEVQERLFREIQEVFGDDDRDVDKNDLLKLNYMEAVIKESIRLYPVAPVVARWMDEDLKIRNHTLSAGNSCFLSYWGLHRHSIWGEDAEDFKPERWLDPSTLPVNPNAFAGFSLGRRGCIGKTYAMMSMKTLLTHVLRRYRITSDISKLELEIDVMVKPVSGHHISIEERN